MHDVDAVHIGHRANDLSVDECCLLLRQALLRPSLDVMVEVPASAELHDEVHLRSAIDDFIQSHDVLVPQVGEHVYLPVKGSRSLLHLQVPLFVSLQSQYVARGFVDASLHHGVGARADFQPDIELLDVKHLFGRRRVLRFIGFILETPFVVLVDHLQKRFPIPLTLIHVGGADLLQYLGGFLQQLVLADA